MDLFTKAKNLGLQIEKDTLVEFSQNLVEQFALVTEIPIHKAIRDLRDARDVGYRGRLVALSRKSAFGRLKDRVVTILHALRAYRWHASPKAIL